MIKMNSYSSEQTTLPLAAGANEAIRNCFVVARWRAEPKTEASVKTHRGPTTTGGLTGERSEKKQGAGSSPEAGAITEQQGRRKRIHIRHIPSCGQLSLRPAQHRAVDAIAANSPAQEPTWRPPPPPTSWRHSDAPGGGGASTPCGMTRSCKHWTAPITGFNEYSWQQIQRR